MSSAISGLSAAIDTDFYMKLLLAELRNQDPTEPMSNTDMITQMAQLTTVEAMNNLRMTFSEMLKLQQLLNGTVLMGLQAEYLDGDSLTQGTVTGVSTAGDTVKLVVDGAEVALEDIHRIF